MNNKLRKTWRVGLTCRLFKRFKPEEIFTLPPVVRTTFETVSSVNRLRVEELVFPGERKRLTRMRSCKPLLEAVANSDCRWRYPVLRKRDESCEEPN